MQNHWCETTVDVTKTRFQWTLNDIEYYDPLKVIRSSPFSDNSDHRIRWHLSLEYVSGLKPILNLVIESTPKEFTFRYVIGIKNEHGEEKKFSDISKIVIRHVPPDAKGWQVLVPDNIDVENKAYSTNSKIVIENFELTSKLLVDCEIGVILEMHNWSGSYEQMEPTLDSTFAADVLRELYDSQKGSDVVLVVGQRQFNAHKAILMARSEYFNAMFENQMTESQTNRVDIKDFDENVIEVLLKFLYTGRVTQLTDDVCPQLLSAADKYQLNDLKSICGQYLYSHLNNDNAIQALLLADALNDDKLKNRSLIYIKNSMKQLVDRSDWNLLIETNIPLVKEILLFSTQNK